MLSNCLPDLNINRHTKFDGIAEDRLNNFGDGRKLNASANSLTLRNISARSLNSKNSESKLQTYSLNSAMCKSTKVLTAFQFFQYGQAPKSSNSISFINCHLMTIPNKFPSRIDLK